MLLNMVFNRLKVICYFWLLFILLTTAACYKTTAAELFTATPTSTTAALTVITATSTSTQTPPATAEPLSTFTPIPSLTNTPPPSTTPTNTPTAIPTNTPSPTVTPPIPSILPTPDGLISTTLRVPILMYHYISEPPADADNYRINLSLAPDKFRGQMQYLVDNGYTAIDLYDLILAITERQPLPPKPVILTFDDGYIDAYEYAFPILEEFGLKGTFFIITEYVDYNNPNHMSWAMIEEMAAAGHRMEPHTKTHPDLTNYDWDGQLYQILGAQETLAAHIGYTPRFLCYPGGRYNETSIKVLEALDFWGAVTTQGGKWHGFNDRYEWRRVRIRYDTEMPEFIDIVRLPEETP